MCLGTQAQAHPGVHMRIHLQEYEGEKVGERERERASLVFILHHGLLIPVQLQAQAYTELPLFSAMLKPGFPEVLVFLTHGVPFSCPSESLPCSLGSPLLVLTLPRSLHLGAWQSLCLSEWLGV